MRSILVIWLVIGLMIVPIGLLKSTKGSEISILDPETDMNNSNIRSDLLTYNGFIKNNGQWESNITFMAIAVFGFIGFSNNSIFYYINDPNQNITNETGNIKIIKQDFIECNEIIPEGNEKLNYTNNYFIGNNSDKWVNNVPVYKSIIYKNIWNGIDIKYYINVKNIKYDIIFNPYSDPSKINIRYDGYNNLTCNNTSLKIENDFITLFDSGLDVYYKDNVENKINCSFKLNNDIISYNIDNYDNSETIIIDPVLYSVYLGGNDLDLGKCIKASNNGVIVAYTSRSLNLPLFNGYDIESNGDLDIVVTLLDFNLSKTYYSTYLGGSRQDWPKDIDIDSNGNIILVGDSDSSNFPTTEGAYDRELNGCNDIIICKLNWNCSSLLASTFIGGTEFDFCPSLVIDDNDDFYITGNIYGYGGFPPIENWFTSPNWYDINLFKINNSLTNIIFSKGIGGNGAEVSDDIALDLEGNIIIVGHCEAGSYPVTEGAYDTTFHGGCDIVVTKISPDGNKMIFSTYIGGYYNDQPADVEIDNNNNIHILSYTYSYDFPVTSNGMDKTFNGEIDIAYLILSEYGNNLNYSTFIGGQEKDIAKRLILMNNNAYIVGHTNSYDFPTTIDAYNTELNGKYDIFFMIFDFNNNSINYSTYYGGTENDKEDSYGLDRKGEDITYYNGDFFISTSTWSDNIPPNTFFNTFYNGNSDVLIIKIIINNIKSIIKGPYYGYEGEKIQLSGSNSIGEDLLYRWDFNNDSIWDTNFTTDPMINHTWFDNTNATVVLQVYDGYYYSTDSTYVLVHNVAPSITSVTGPTDPQSISNDIVISGEFSDPGKLDTHTVIIDWNDGTTSQGNVTDFVDGSGKFSGKHIFSTPGVYILNITITDDDGGEGNAEYRYVVIYNASGGFVTGGGWFTSPKGAYVADNSATGKATFGFVSKYNKGKTTPDGNTEFILHFAKFSFKSTSYEWLIVNNEKAKFKGEGTINGKGCYGFIISLIDGDAKNKGDPDLFRIKIWDKNDNDKVVYDNMMDSDDSADPTTAISGGSIKIHKG